MLFITIIYSLKHSLEIVTCNYTYSYLGYETAAVVDHSMFD
jgi:hypothetical protein